MLRSSRRHSAGHVLRHRACVYLVGLILSLFFAHVAMMIWQNGRPERIELPPGYTSLEMLRAGKFWTLLSHVWVHAEAFHLGVNLLLLYAFGRAVEQRMGGVAFMGIFAASGVGGALGQLLLGMHSNAAIIGASGAIFGVIGACGVLLGRRPVVNRGRLWLSYRSLTIGLIGANFVLEIAVRAGLPLGGSVAYITHLVGGILGAAMAYWLGQGNDDEVWGMDSLLPPSLPVEEYVPMPTMRQAAEVQANGDSEGESWKLGNNLGAQRLGMTLEERVDRVLDRVAHVGVAGLTEKERLVLDEAAKRLGKKNES